MAIFLDEKYLNCGAPTTLCKQKASQAREDQAGWLNLEEKQPFGMFPGCGSRSSVCPVPVVCKLDTNLLHSFLSSSKCIWATQSPQVIWILVTPLNVGTFASEGKTSKVFK